jgi:hypothetical protein
MRRTLVLAALVLGCGRSALPSSDDSGLVDAGGPRCTVGRTYLDCFCGCCGGSTPARRCVSPSRGEDFDALVRQAQEARAAADCSVVGCSLGTELVCCD